VLPPIAVFLLLGVLDLKSFLGEERNPSNKKYFKILDVMFFDLQRVA
jgi:hypothetical protein